MKTGEAVMDEEIIVIEIFKVLEDRRITATGSCRRNKNVR
jgi:hypothetical protein